MNQFRQLAAAPSASVPRPAASAQRTQVTAMAGASRYSARRAARTGRTPRTGSLRQPPAARRASRPAPAPPRSSGGAVLRPRERGVTRPPGRARRRPGVRPPGRLGQPGELPRHRGHPVLRPRPLRQQEFARGRHAPTLTRPEPPPTAANKLTAFTPYERRLALPSGDLHVASVASARMNEKRQPVHS